MPSYSGTFSAGKAGDLSQPGICRLDLEGESMTLLPQSGPPLSLDLGDIDELLPADFELKLKIYTGETILFSRFGKSYQDLCRELQEAYRKRLVQCLLLDDLEEIGRYGGAAELQSPGGSFFAPAEIRLYQSNFAVLPEGQTGFQWRLAEIDGLEFDPSSYTVLIRSGEERLLVSRLAKRTREFQERLQTALDDVAARSAQAVRSVFPFLTAAQFQQTAELLKEGRAAQVAQLAAIHPKTAQALADKVVSSRLKPYYDALIARGAGNVPYAGFKLIRREEAEGDPAANGGAVEQTSDEPGVDPLSAVAGEMESGTDPGTEGETEILHWFFVPLTAGQDPGAPRAVAWETTSRSGRATYFFPAA